jgi:hypothetical protein
MGVPAPITNFVGLFVTLTVTQRKYAIKSPFQSSREPHELEDWLEAQPQRFVMLGITCDSYGVLRSLLRSCVGYLTFFGTSKQLVAQP